MTFRFALLISFMLFTAAAAAQVSAPKYANEFLNVGVGARALGMSLAQAASVNDVTAGYWNPAGLAGMKGDLQASAMHSEYFAGIAKYDYVSVGKSLDSVSAASISIIRFGVDDIPNTTELIDADGNLDYNRITTFSAVDYAFIFSYGHKGLPFLPAASRGGMINATTGNVQGFRWGASAKVIYRHIGDFARAWGFGIDAGVQYTRNQWHFAAVAKDVTSTFNAWSFNLSDRMKEVFEQTNNDLPQNGLEVALPRLILGTARSFNFNKVAVLAEANVVMTTDGRRNTLVSANPVSLDPSIGAEVAYNQTIFLRIGAGNAQRATDFDGSQYLTLQPNIGLGLRIRQFFLDYAFSDIGNASDALYSNVFSLRYVFVKK
jgi:hypothetical protein